MRRLLLVDDEINVLHALQRALRQCSFKDDIRVEIFRDPVAALTRAVEVDFDLAISDFQMPQMNGVDFLKKLRQIQPDAVRLVLSASTEFDTVMRAINEAEVFRYIPKPWRPDELEEVIQHALARRSADDAVRLQTGKISARELAERKLEADEPGITKVNWGPDGSVRLD